MTEGGKARMTEGGEARMTEGGEARMTEGGKARIAEGEGNRRMDPRLLMSRMTEGEKAGMTEGGKARMTEGTSVEDDRKESLKLPHPAHFHEVAFEVEDLRVGFAQLVGKRDLGAEAVHRQRAVQ